MKTCTICLESKTYESFHRQASRKDGYANWCKPCKSDRKKQDYMKNKPAILAKLKLYREANPDKVSQAKKRCYLNKRDEYRDRAKLRYEEKRLDILEYSAKYRELNKTAIAERNSSYVRRRMKEDHLFRLAYTVRNRIFIAFRAKSLRKGTKTRDMIGCDWETLKVHIESKFKPGMTWDNRSEWHIDHIRPLASANDADELHQLCHYTNLQPLWAAENLSKGAKLLGQA